MDCTTAVQRLVDDTSRVVACRPSGREGVLLLTTTSLYSDHDHVQVTVEDVGDVIRVTDGGLTMLRLDMHGAPIHQKGHQRRVERIVSSYGVRFDRDIIELLAEPASLPGAVAAVASAAVQIDTLIHEEPTQRRTFVGDVERWLKQRAPKPVSKSQVPGHTYTVLKVATRHPVYVQPVAGGRARVNAIQQAGWRMEAGANLTQAQRVMMLGDEVNRYPVEEIDRILDFATITTWSDRLLLLDHLRGADQVKWDPTETLLVDQQML